MKINKLNQPHSYEKNARFNLAAQPIVDELFQTADEHPIGYLRSAKREPIISGYKSRYGNIEIISDAARLPKSTGCSIMDTQNAGPYEELVLACLAYGHFTVLAIVGDMGSGKTTSARQIKQFLKAKRSQMCSHCRTCTPVVIHLDFNEALTEKKSDKVCQQFRRKLQKLLRAHIRELMRTDESVKDFIRTLTDGSDKEHEFALFDAFGQIFDENPTLLDTTTFKLLNMLFRFIDEEEKNGSDGLELLMLLVRYTKYKIRPDESCFTIIYDNLDSLPFEAQHEILVDIMAYHKIAKVKGLTLLRATTFERLNNQAAYSFGMIEHSGPGVYHVVEKRIKHYLDNWDQEPILRGLNADDKVAVRRRFEYLLSSANDPFGPLARIVALSGSSVRHGLYLMTRTVINNVVPYDEAPQYRDDLVRAVLLSGARSLEVSLRDEYIANLFADPDDGSFSLICLRIVQLVAALQGHSDWRNTNTIGEVVRKIGDNKWTRRKLLSALNYLMLGRSPLIWVDGRTSYRDTNELSGRSDIIYLSDMGRAYVRNVLFDFVYLQECLTSVSWPGDGPTAVLDYTLLVSRFTTLRRCLGEVVEADVNQTEKFVELYGPGGNQQNVIELKPRLISTRIVARSASSVLGIARNQLGQVDVANELKDWGSLVIRASNFEGSFDCTTTELERVLRQYETVFPELGGRKGM